ncbi:MAG TPA: ABC transporter permease [Promineifilum sp.]
MARLILRKLVLMVFILGLLSYVAYHYALLHPELFTLPFGGVPDEPPPRPESHYFEFLRGLLQGDLGEIAFTPIADVLREPIINSFVLLICALTVTICLGLLFGFLAISPRTSRLRPVALALLAAGSSMPGFVFGAVVLSLLVYQILFTAAKEPWLPLSGYGLDGHLILPVIVLAIQPTFHLAKVVAGLLENELQKDYILVARSKGLTRSLVFGRHAWRNMLSPVLITIGEAARLMIGGLVIVEAIFLWPGIGRIFLNAIGLRLNSFGANEFFGNPNLIAILAVLIGGALLFADLVTSVLAYQLDPRLSYGSGDDRTEVLD